MQFQVKIIFDQLEDHKYLRVSIILQILTEPRYDGPRQKYIALPSYVLSHSTHTICLRHTAAKHVSNVGAIDVIL